MKKIICVLLSIMMMFGMVSALASGAVDLSAMSAEELQSLYWHLC